MRYIGMLSIVLLVFGSCRKTTTGPDEPPPHPPVIYEIDFYPACQGNQVFYLHAAKPDPSDTAGIYTIDLNGENKRLILPSTVPLTFDWFYPNLLVVSDGTVYKVDLGDSAITPLTKPESFYVFPSISPDGRKILVENPYWPDAGIWLMNLDGSDLHKIIPGAQFPDWSRDGTKMVGILPYTEIVVADTGGNIIKGINCPGIDVRYPKFSPDDSKIVFSSQAEGSAPQIWIMNSDGSNMHQITTTGGNFPEWTANGQIIFTNLVNGYLYLMNDDGTGLKAITK